MKKEIYYSFCPIANATYVAVNEGILQRKMQEAGYEAVQLQALPREYWKAHFTYENDSLFRDGGYTSAIYAKGNGAGLRLIGVKVLKEKEFILVREDSAIRSAEDLPGKKIAVSVHPNVIFDAHRYTMLQNCEMMLARLGLGKERVEWVPFINENGIPREGTCEKGGPIDQKEIEALDSGAVDAVYGKYPRSLRMLAGGKYRAVATGTSVYPELLTVSEKLAASDPGAVFKYMEAEREAAAWAAANPKAALAHLAKQTNSTEEEFGTAFGTEICNGLKHTLTDEDLDCVQERIRFMYDHGCIKEAVDASKWADASFIKE